MARSIVLLAAAVILAGVLVAPSNAQTPTDAAIQQQIQQIINGVVTQINYCVSNVSVPTACPAMAPLFTALNISAKLQESFLSSDSPSGAPAPAPASPFAACFNTLSPDSFLYGINPALVLPLCNNTKCATASAQVDTCITGVIDNVAGPSFGDSPAAAPSPSDPGEGSNSPDVPGAIAQFCTSPVCVSEAKAATPPPPPPAGGAATVKMSVLAVATLSMIVLGAAL